MSYYTNIKICPYISYCVFITKISTEKSRIRDARSIRGFFAVISPLSIVHLLRKQTVVISRAAILMISHAQSDGEQCTLSLPNKLA